MEKYEYLYKYSELVQTANEKEAKMEAFIQNWLNGNSGMSSYAMEQIIIQVNDQIAQLRNEAQKYLMEFERISKEEQLQQEQLQSSNAAKMRLRDMLGVDTNSIVIPGGVLSSNASESHLIGRKKTPEEIELDKQIALSTLREKIAKKEISLVQVSQLKIDIENYYGMDNEINYERHM
jgi:hypothetical protein